MAREPSTTLSWPLYAIDFEASSLEDCSYPIEVGIAVWPACEAPILGWSTLGDTFTTKIVLAGARFSC
jgi:hypothetical protein